jgi:DNA-binding XRE family transcriptional regulator
MASRKTIGSPEQPIVVERDSVIIPRDEWERISAAAARAERLEAIDEDRADARIARRALERVAAGDDEFVPLALATRILDGEHPVRVWREYRGLTGAKLAKRAGATQSYISNIETGKRQGSLRIMLAIARALGVDVEDLVPHGGGA